VERALRRWAADGALWVAPDRHAAVLVLPEQGKSRRLNLAASDLNGDGARTLAIVVDSLVGEHVVAVAPAAPAPVLDRVPPLAPG